MPIFNLCLYSISSIKGMKNSKILQPLFHHLPSLNIRTMEKQRLTLKSLYKNGDTKKNLKP